MVEMLPTQQGLSLPALIWDLRADLRRRFRSADPTLRSKWMAWLVTSGTKEYRALLDAGFMIHWLSRQAVDYPGLSPLQQLIWHARPDVQMVHALPQDTAEYLGWFFCHGVGEHALWPWLTASERRQACMTEGPWQAALLQQASDAMLLDAESPAESYPLGVNLVGYVHGQLGIGEDVRMAARALDAVGVPMALINFKPGHDVAQNDMTWRHRVVELGPYGTNVFCLTAMEHGRFFAERGFGQTRGRINIGYWPWELGNWPATWRQLVHLVDEVWVSTRHTLEAVSPACAALTPPVPVRLMPMAVTVDEVPRYKSGKALEAARRATRLRWHLPVGACLFCFSFDLNSSIHRKNPVAVLKAFQRAFPPDLNVTEQVGLVIKVHPPARPHPTWTLLKAWAKQDPRLHLIEETLPRTDLLQLYQACDAFVSLHRAEGFGRGIAEALQLGLRVVTTGYSGNVDFCQRPEFADRAHMVKYRLIKVRRGQYPYAQGQEWANADVKHAAQCLREVAAQVKARGGRLLPVPVGGWPVFSAAEVGQRYRDRLREIWRHSSVAPGGQAASGNARLQSGIVPHS